MLTVGKPVDLLLVGDSLVHGWSETHWKARRLISPWRTLASAQHALWRLSDPSLARARAGMVIVLIGTNNLAAGDAPCAIASAIEAVGRRGEELWPGVRVFLVKIPPRGEDWKFKQTERQELNAEIGRIADRRQWRVLDIDNLMSCGFSKGCAHYQADRLHFSVE